MKPDSCLTSSVQLGAYTLSNRIVIAPMARSLAQNNLPQPEAVNYYTDRATCGLIITEPTLVSPVHTLSNYPGIYTRQQVRSWRKITESVREKNGKFFLQLWYGETTKHSIDTSIVSIFRRAAQNALAADFDGVEICANFSYLSDRQSQNSTHEAENSYNIELENKTQLLLTIIEEVASVWDENKVGIKLISDSFFLQAKASRLSSFFYCFINNLNFYNLAYLHLENSIIKIFYQSNLLGSWLKLFHTISSGKLIINCQDNPQKAKDAIVNCGVDLVSFNDLSKLLIF